jgi:hypothetical protein
MDDLIVAFRTHVWDETVAALAQRLYDSARGARFVVLADESKTELDTDCFEKISHNDDFTSLGLPNFPPGRVLWYNADYPLYILRRWFPQAAYFAMVEYDVAVNIDFYDLLRTAQRNSIDLLAHSTVYASRSWNWYPTVAPYFDRPMSALLSTMIISARAIDALYARRLSLSTGRTIENHSDWPFCEGFIPSVVSELPDSKIDYLSNYVAVPFYSWNGAIHLNAPEANMPGSLCHPVLSGRAFVNKCIANARPDDVFDQDSRINKQLSFCKPNEFIEPLTNFIKSKRSPELLQRFKDLAEENSWPSNGIRTNLAFGKPTNQSSTCKWSRSLDRKVDSLGGNNGVVTGGFGFHTDFETYPWWEVDLEDHFFIRNVTVYNRLEHAKRCTKMTLSSSDDGKIWTLRGAKLDDGVFGGADGNPYVFEFPVAFKARLLRVGLIGEGFLHLDEIEVYGDEV